MLKPLAAALALALGLISAASAAESWPKSRQQILDASGRPLLVPRVAFFKAGTTTPLEVYSDAALTKPLAQPVKADGTGRFPRVYLPAALYAEEVFGPHGDVLWRDDGLGYVPPTTAGGGGSGTVDLTAIAATGDVKWRMDAGIMPGWVRMNGRTLGGAGSGATELASASASAAFSYLWNTFPDTVASVVGGRGTSASSDFSAGKQIVIPTMQGLLQGGLDDMGSSPAGRFQTITDLTLSAGSTTATVFNSVRLAIGMTVIANGISAGTTITDINGTTITLSQPAAAGSTGTVSGARFSALGDAQMPGQIGGDTFTGLSNKNLPAVLPGGSVIVDYPAHTYITHETLATASINGSGIAFSWTPNQMQYGLGFVDDLSNPAARATLIRDATILDNSSARTFASLGGKQLFGIDTTQALEMSAALIMKSAQRICFDGPFNCMGANVVTGGGNVGVSFDGGIKPRTYNSVASLPTCNFDVLGLQAFLYAGDANAPTTGGTVSTGSTVVSRPIVCDSASWRYMN